MLKKFIIILDTETLLTLLNFDILQKRTRNYGRLTLPWTWWERKGLRRQIEGGGLEVQETLRKLRTSERRQTLKSMAWRANYIHSFYYFFTSSWYWKFWSILRFISEQLLEVCKKGKRGVLCNSYIHCCIPE